MAQGEHWHEKSAAALADAAREKRDALRQFRFGATGSRARNVRLARSLRRDIARILTEWSRRRLGR